MFKKILIYIIDKLEFLLEGLLPYLLSPKRPLVAFGVCFVFGIALCWGVVQFFGRLQFNAVPFDTGFEMVVYWLSMIAVPFILLKLYWDQLNRNKDIELKERELNLKRT